MFEIVCMFITVVCITLVCASWGLQRFRRPKTGIPGIYCKFSAEGNTSTGSFGFGMDPVQELRQVKDKFLIFCEHSVWELYINTGTGLLEQRLVRYL